MEKKWIPGAEIESVLVAQLAAELKISSILAVLLLQRGIDTFEKARHFFRPSLDDLHDPFLMKDMEKAVERLTLAVHHGEKILVYGDYDVDGTTAVTLMFSFLQGIGAHCDYYIPDRYTEGYGFSFSGVEFAKTHGFTLIITLDCGIRDGEKIDFAAGHGIDVIVCDHHIPGEIPRACAVLDPKRVDCDYPFKGLSGCGVGFKLLQGFCIQHSIPNDELLGYLDLLAISIGADIVPVTGENRILAHFGLELMRHYRRPGIASMLKQSGFKKDALTITDLVFILAPRINAAGRIVSGKQAVALLLAKDEAEAQQLSPALEDNNKTRKSLDKEITGEARQQIAADPFYDSSFGTVVSGIGWSKGVVGIVASRLIESYYKPTVVLVDDGEKMSGSARSIYGIDLFDILGECNHLLTQFGGHSMAAGLSLKTENFEAFKIQFDTAIRNKLDNVHPVPFIQYDAEIHFEEITAGFFKILKQFGPFGPENMNPVFLVRNVQNARFTKTVGETNAHLKLHVNQKRNLLVTMDGIAFDLGVWIDAIKAGTEVDLLFTLEENEWNGRTSIQLNVKDIRLTATPDQQ